jgi:hypothetical protein
MPRPSYIICCQSCSEDKRTGAFSLFNIVEKFQLNQLPPPPPGTVPVISSDAFAIVASWSKLPDDPQDQEYEFETILHLPNGNAIETPRNSFVYEEGKPNYRITVFVSAAPVMETSGVLRIENRLRRTGATDDEWIRQDYSILVEVIPYIEDGANH